MTTSCCKLKCECCHICVHTYECSCIDFNLKATICKHIHYVSMKMKEENPSQSPQDEIHADEVNNLIKQVSTSRTNEVIIKEIEQSLNVIRSNLQRRVHSKDELNLILNNVKTAASITGLSKSHVPLKECAENSEEPANKKVEKQFFFSTKVKKGKKKEKMKKPSKEDITVIKESLTDTVHVSTNASNDHNYTNIR